MNNSVYTSTLNNGSAIGVCAIKISSIPHLSILTSAEEWSLYNDQINAQYKEDMQILLYEVYQHYRMCVIEKGMDINESIELLWKTTKIDNQPYKANISLYIIIRCIDSDKVRVMDAAKSIMNICCSSLTRGKYRFFEIGIEELKSELDNCTTSHTIAIYKDERVDAINTSALQAAYSYDVIMPTTVDMDKLINALIMHPDCCVSFQLIPTYFTNDESNEISTKTQVLDMLQSGVSVNGVGTVQVKSAKRACQTYQYYLDNADGPLFMYCLTIHGSRQSALEVAAKLMGQLNQTKDRPASLSYKWLQNINLSSIFLLAPWTMLERILGECRNPSVWNSGYVSAVSQRLSFIITNKEASEMFRLPIGNNRIGAGLNINETGYSSTTYAKGIINECQLPVGMLKSSANKDTIGLRLLDLAKHMLIVGTPGSGKTNFSVGLLRTLWLKYKIPFLVIEPAKNEYRALIQNIPDLQIFTPGKNHISPFVFNPFIPPENVKLEAYKSTLKTAFAAGVTMTSPLDKIFEDSIDNCYSKFRWLNSYTKDDKGRYFNISDFVNCFIETFNSIGYTGDSRNIGRAGIVRLQGLVKLFDNYHSIPIHDLLSKPTVIELAAIENSDEKALYIALILLSVLSYVNANYVGEGDELKNFILVEEAHVLLDSSSNGGEGAANPAAIAQGLVKRMLAEIRSYGVSVAIADQSPRKVGIDIIALTDIKLSFRLVEKEDREILANSSGMDNKQMSRLSKLKPGEAFLFFNKMSNPEEIITPENRNSQGYKVSMSDSEIEELSSYWKERKEKLKPYPECDNLSCCVDTCDIKTRMLAREIAKRICNRYQKSNLLPREILNGIKPRLRFLIAKELNGEVFNERLGKCTWMHIYRQLKYKTSIK